MTLTSRFALGTAASLVLAASPSFAQTTGQATPAATPAAETPVAQLPESQLRSYARAWMTLTNIQREMQPRIQAATGEAKTALEQQAAERMREAVEGAGLDPALFNRISTAMRSDQALSARINTYVQEAAAAQAETSTEATATAAGGAQGTAADGQYARARSPRRRPRPQPGAAVSVSQSSSP